jgi:hypothetical protein
MLITGRELNTGGQHGRLVNTEDRQQVRSQVVCSAHAHLRVAHIGQPHPVNGGHQHRLFARLMGPGTSNPPSLLLLAVIGRFFEECNAVPSAVRWREQHGHDQRAAIGTYMRGVCGKDVKQGQKVDLNLIATGRDRHAVSGHFGQTAPLHVACHRVGGHPLGMKTRLRIQLR